MGKLKKVILKCNSCGAVITTAEKDNLKKCSLVGCEGNLTEIKHG